MCVFGSVPLAGPGQACHPNATSLFAVTLAAADKSGSAALKLGVESGPQMTPECAVVKLMLCLAYRDLPLGMPLAGEL